MTELTIMYIKFYLGWFILMGAAIYLIYREYKSDKLK